MDSNRDNGNIGAYGIHLYICNTLKNPRPDFSQANGGGTHPFF